jgi:hypothetical protein
MKHSPGFLKIVNEAKSRVKEVDFREVKEWMDTREIVTLVDVREESEWARGHLPGAMHLGKGVIERDIEQVFPISRLDWCFIAAVVSVPLWLPIICRRWATPT